MIRVLLIICIAFISCGKKESQELKDSTAVSSTQERGNPVAVAWDQINFKGDSCILVIDTETRSLGSFSNRIMSIKIPSNYGITFLDSVVGEPIKVRFYLGDRAYPDLTKYAKDKLLGEEFYRTTYIVYEL